MLDIPILSLEHWLPMPATDVPPTSARALVVDGIATRIGKMMMLAIIGGTIAAALWDCTDRLVGCY